MTVGSRSMKTVRGTCLPEPVSEKKVLKASSPPPIVLSEGIWPSGWMPCSRQKSSQHALPVWMPAWPRWRVMHSRCGHGEEGGRQGRVRSAIWGAGARAAGGETHHLY